MTSSGAERLHRLVLDTSAYSHFRSGHPGVLDALARAGRVLLPSTVLGELHAAFELGTRTRDNRRLLDDFLDEVFVESLDATPSTAVHYGRLFAALKRAGTPLPINDIWIAAATLDCGGTLLTFDRDFAHVSGLTLVLLDQSRQD